MNRIAWEPGPRWTCCIIPEGSGNRWWATAACAPWNLTCWASHGSGTWRERTSRLSGWSSSAPGRPGRCLSSSITMSWTLRPCPVDYEVIGRLIRGGPPSTSVDERALGTWLIRTGDSSGIALLEQAFRRGSEQAGVALALHHKRRREWGLAAEAWKTLLAGTRSLRVAVELAKHYEHRTRQYEAALRAARLRCRGICPWPRGQGRKSGNGVRGFGGN